ncbi:MAG: insulinase family protein [Cyclobacteriaceae bacterium]|nr:insulinase family protein [Cyclobacteriaceae bacterium]
MKRLFLISLAIISVLWSCSDQHQSKFVAKTAEEGGYSYEYVEGDPTKTRIYTLDNGLKVYLSVYKDEPRVQVYLPVKAGGKNDPAENTGLAHYLEHMMFKGNDQFGTLDYTTEKVMLDSIEHMFNHYATLTDSLERKNYYALIDTVSGDAAKHAIPNEYDKLISGIGGKGLNAYTTEDRTVYTVDIPANEIERFLEIEGVRFRNIVNRLFHTELEAVYEEKNRSLDSDGWKVFEALMKGLFEKHPYGTQTVIGTIEHLKNPSITAIKKYFYDYYRPNNVAICMSGDLDPTSTIQLIDKYFGDWQPNEQLSKAQVIEEDSITSPRATEVYGPDAERVSFAFRFPGRIHPDHIKLEVVDMILNNAEAGLIDLNLAQKQKVLSAGSYVNTMNDYSMHVFNGTPKEGQTLEEVKGLILGEIDKVKKGEFDDWLIKAVITDFKKSAMSGLESNRSRANGMVLAFTNEMPWKDYISRLDRMEKLTKEDIVRFANDYYKDNYALVFKRTGEDPNKLRVEKPQITKVPLNRDVQSAFYQHVMENEPPKLQPVFIDFQQDIARGALNGGVEVLSKKNQENELFSLSYLIDVGGNNDPAMKVAASYLEYLGTSMLDAESFKKELYKLGCSFSVFAADERTYVTLSGLDENMEVAMDLFEQLLSNPQPDQEALEKLIDRSLKAREDAKKNKGGILFSGLMNYGQYGPKNSFTNVLSNGELTNLQPAELIDRIRKITTMEHRILYYGPRDAEKVLEVLKAHHPIAEELAPLPNLVEFKQVPTDQPKVYWTHYDMVQTEFIMMHKGNRYDKSIAPQVRMFNEYFGGGMNSIVFQEIREAQGLAYSVFSSYSTPSKASEDDVLFAYVGTQSDKQPEAMKAMKELLDNMPESEKAFDLARQAILSKIESERITKAGILWSYESAKQKGLDYDIRKDIYEKVQSITFEDLKKFHAAYVKDKSYVTVMIGHRDKINFEDLQQYGEVKELSLEEIFGYDKVEKVDLELE